MITLAHSNIWKIIQHWHSNICYRVDICSPSFFSVCDWYVAFPRCPAMRDDGPSAIISKGPNESSGRCTFKWNFRRTVPRAPLAGRSAWLFLSRDPSRRRGCYRCLMNDTERYESIHPLVWIAELRNEGEGDEAVGKRDIFTGRKVVFPRLLTSIFLRATFIDSPFTAES